MSGISIRWRIAVWNTAAFAVVLLGFGLLVYSLLRQMHFDQVDAGLLARSERVLADTKVSGDPEKRFAFWVRRFGKHVEISGVVLDASGGVVAQADSLKELPPNELNVASTSRPQFDSLVVPEFGHARRVRVEVPTQKGPYSLMLLAEMEHVDEELDGVLKVLLLTIPVTLFVAAALSYLLACKALAPVEQLSCLSNEITAERLDRRLPIPNAKDELGHLARTINSMIARLESSFDEVRRFTGDASHELRTPITIIRSEAEMGIDVADDPTEARKRFQSILEESSRLTSATSQLLTLSRNDAGVGRSVEEEVDLEELLLEVAGSMRPRAIAKRQELRTQFEDGLTLQSDPERLRQVFHNLLDNAIKYTPEEGCVEMRSFSNSDEITVEVRDNGVGIGEEHRSRVFDRFYRINIASEVEQDGVGLGLSIVESNVDLLGGCVELFRLDSQTVFRVSFPNTAR